MLTNMTQKNRIKDLFESYEITRVFEFPPVPSDFFLAFLQSKHIFDLDICKDITLIPCFLFSLHFDDYLRHFTG